MAPPRLELPRLIDDLASPDTLRRETAIARLAIVGGPAVKPLTGLAADESRPPSARAAALRALAGIGDARAVKTAAVLATAPDEAIAIDAMDVLAAHVGGNAPESVVAFERLTEIALDRSAPVERRLTALSALDSLPEKTLRPVFDALASDPARTVVARVVRRRAGALLSLEDLIERGAQDPRLVQAALEEEGATVRVTVLRTLVEAARAAERAAPAPDAAVWLAVRGQAHQALASRSSRIALYDVREALERGPHPLPVGFLAAAAAIGDVSCLLPLAAAWIAAAGDERWWRDHLAEAFASIVKREKIRRRDPALRKILERWPQAGTLVATAR